MAWIGKDERNRAHTLIERLMERYPAAFGKKKAPLKIGIHHDILADLPREDVDDLIWDSERESDDLDTVRRRILSTALGVYTRTRGYNTAVAAGRKRVSLDGTEAGDVEASHVKGAKTALRKRGLPVPGEPAPKPDPNSKRSQRKREQAQAREGASAGGSGEAEGKVAPSSSNGGEHGCDSGTKASTATSGRSKLTLSSKPLAPEAAVRKNRTSTTEQTCQGQVGVEHRPVTRKPKGKGKAPRR